MIRECWKDNVKSKFGRVKGGYIGQKVKVGVEAMCVEIDSRWVTITLLVLQMTPLMQIEKIALDHHIPIIISTQKKYSK